MATAAKPRTQPPEVRRAQLLDAAAAVLVDKGLASTTVADVAERAGLAKGTVYLYFDTKEALIAGLQVRYHESLVDLARQLNAGAGSSLDRLDAFVKATVDLHVSDRDLHRVLFHDAGMRDDHSLREVAREIQRFVERGVADGELTVTDPVVSTEFLLHGMHGALVTFLHHPTGKARFAAACAGACRQLLGGG